MSTTLILHLSPISCALALVFFTRTSVVSLALTLYIVTFLFEVKIVVVSNKGSHVDRASTTDVTKSADMFGALVHVIPDTAKRSESTPSAAGLSWTPPDVATVSYPAVHNMPSSPPRPSFPSTAVAWDAHITIPNPRLSTSSPLLGMSPERLPSGSSRDELSLGRTLSTLRDDNPEDSPESNYSSFRCDSVYVPAASSPPTTHRYRHHVDAGSDEPEDADLPQLEDTSYDEEDDVEDDLRLDLYERCLGLSTLEDMSMCGYEIESSDEQFDGDDEEDCRMSSTSMGEDAGSKVDMTKHEASFRAYLVAQGITGTDIDAYWHRAAMNVTF